jgi:hypothetical protein
VYLVPRVAARCAALAGRWPEAEQLLERAIASARSSGARVELALSILDRARLRVRRRDLPLDAKRVARDLDEAIPALEELAMRPALREALSLRHADAR